MGYTVGVGLAVRRIVGNVVLGLAVGLFVGGLFSFSFSFPPPLPYFPFFDDFPFFDPFPPSTSTLLLSNNISSNTKPTF